jgi:2-oxoglutarate dehydrogenase E1 component
MLRRSCFTSPVSLKSSVSSTLRHQSTAVSPTDLAKAWLQLQYQVQGHKIADYDPLKKPKPVIPELQPGFYGLSDTDPAVSEMIQRGKQLFCGTSSTEMTHVNTEGQAEWVISQVMNKKNIPAPVQRQVLKELLEADVLEDFFNKRFVGVKRFGLEGGEALIPGLRALVDVAGECNANRVVIGMAHRGRLQVLHHLCGKPLWNIFREFQDVILPGTQLTNKGDVKYHLGHKTVHKTSSGRDVTVECLPNPSHLEAVNPVVTGFARGTAELDNIANPNSSIPVLLHGDAAIIGQGVCFETMLFEEIRDYQVGGTIHVVVNNQVGFTTDPSDSRSSEFSTALAYLNNSPVIRVNGDSPLRVIEAFKLAVRHREKFHEDVFIDLVCYRRRGHNEGDAPDFTQPLLYKKIRDHPTTASIFSNALIEQKVVTAEEVEEWREEIMDRYKDEYKKAADGSNAAKPTLLAARQFDTNGYPNPATGVDVATLRELGLALNDKSKLPQGFEPHTGTWNSTIEQRRKSFVDGAHIVWASAEQLAIASLLKDGYNVRFSGEDIQRGTWAQRHYVLHNTNDKRLGEEYCSLKELSKQFPAGVSEKFGKVTLANSPLSEYGVAGYEFGYAAARPDSLTLWEAQFGDFANGAQIIWDQFLSSSIPKWNQRTGLAVSLPHGFDGQGPEHSSARIERWLQSSNDRTHLPDSAAADNTTTDPYNALEGRCIGCNWIVAYPSTPANYFHMLRRQVLRKPEHRIPVVFFFSKAGLRTVPSTLAEMGEGTRFEPVLVSAQEQNAGGDAKKNPAKTVILCTGQVNVALKAKRDQEKLNDSVAIITIEQLAPFPYENLRKALRSVGASEATRFVWAQEEPKNAGAWTHVRPRLRLLLQSMFNSKQQQQQQIDVEYAGRPSSGSPSTGYGYVHKQELTDLLNSAFGTK